MDIDSIRNRLYGTRVVKKDDVTVVKADSGSLCIPRERLEDEEITEIVSAIQALKKVSEENGADFLYCAAPSKELYEHLPSNIDNYYKDNFARFLEEMKDSDIPIVDLSNAFMDMEESDIFYYTDHHWKARSAFIATSTICRELSLRYGFEYNEQYTDIKNYNVDLYKNWFLGSYGKKVGTYFSGHGRDDFELIIPNFKTYMTEEQPFKNEASKGAFTDTVLFMENMEKDYYHKNPYATYSGGDFRLQIMKNNLNSDGAKILLVRESFSCALAPFLALQTGELHVCDVREGDYSGDKLDLEEYIQDIKPDYVLVLYNGVKSIRNSDGRYDFLNN